MLVENNICTTLCWWLGLMGFFLKKALLQKVLLKYMQDEVVLQKELGGCCILHTAQCVLCGLQQPLSSFSSTLPCRGTALNTLCVSCCVWCGRLYLCYKLAAEVHVGQVLQKGHSGC
jgi:hypothetical protein